MHILHWAMAMAFSACVHFMTLGSHVIVIIVMSATVSATKRLLVREKDKKKADIMGRCIAASPISE